MSAAIATSDHLENICAPEKKFNESNKLESERDEDSSAESERNVDKNLKSGSNEDSSSKSERNVDSSLEPGKNENKNIESGKNKNSSPESENKEDNSPESGRDKDSHSASGRNEDNLKSLRNDLTKDTSPEVLVNRVVMYDMQDPDRPPLNDWLKHYTPGETNKVDTTAVRNIIFRGIPVKMTRLTEEWDALLASSKSIDFTVFKEFARRHDVIGGMWYIDIESDTSEEADSIWRKIVKAIAEKRMPSHLAKVNQNNGSGKHQIVIYNKDFTDEKQVYHVESCLRSLDIQTAMKYAPVIYSHVDIQRESPDIHVRHFIYESEYDRRIDAQKVNHEENDGDTVNKDCIGQPEPHLEPEVKKSTIKNTFLINCVHKVLLCNSENNKLGLQDQINEDKSSASERHEDNSTESGRNEDNSSESGRNEDKSPESGKNEDNNTESAVRNKGKSSKSVKKEDKSSESERSEDNSSEFGKNEDQSSKSEKNEDKSTEFVRNKDKSSESVRKEDKSSESKKKKVPTATLR